MANFKKDYLEVDEKVIAQQEAFIAKNLDLDETKSLSNDNIALAKRIYEEDQRLLSVEEHLFDAYADLHPKEKLQAGTEFIENFINDLIEQTKLIAEFAVTQAPALTFDCLIAYKKDYHLLMANGSTEFKEASVMMFKEIEEITDQKNMVRLADLLKTTGVRLLRSLFKQEDPPITRAAFRKWEKQHDYLSRQSVYKLMIQAGQIPPEGYLEGNYDYGDEDYDDADYEDEGDEVEEDDKE